MSSPARVGRNPRSGFRRNKGDGGVVPDFSCTISLIALQTTRARIAGLVRSAVAIIPAAPASITVPASSYTVSFGVCWGASGNASSYVLNQSANGGAWTQLYSGSATSRTVTVPASGNYKYEVKACGAGGCSGYASSGTVAVTLPPAGAPSLSSSATTSTSGTYTLSWSAAK